MSGTPIDCVPERLRGIVLAMLKAPIYREACKVLAAHDKDTRARLLSSIPESIRPLVEAEARRVWVIRRVKNS